MDLPRKRRSERPEQVAARTRIAVGVAAISSFAEIVGAMSDFFLVLWGGLSECCWGSIAILVLVSLLLRRLGFTMALEGVAPGPL